MNLNLSKIDLKILLFFILFSLITKRVIDEGDYLYLIVSRNLYNPIGGYVGFLSLAQLLFLALAFPFSKNINKSFIPVSLFAFINYILLVSNPYNHSHFKLFGLSVFAEFYFLFELCVILFFTFYSREKILLFYESLLDVFYENLNTVLAFGLFYYLFFGGFVLEMFAGVPSTFPFEDIQLYINIFFLMNLLRGRFSLMNFSLLSLFHLLSLRRTALYFLFLGTILIFFFKSNTKRKLQFLLLGFSIYIGIIFISNNLNFFNTEFQIFFTRYFGAFFDLNVDFHGSEFIARNAHFDESEELWYYYKEYNGFWGHGFGKVLFPYEFPGSQGLHNAIVSIWFLYGIHTLIFLFFSLLYFLFISVYKKGFRSWKNFIPIFLWYFLSWYGIHEIFYDTHLIFLKYLLFFYLIYSCEKNFVSA